MRGVGQGFCYNVGRGIGAVFPALVGFLAARLGLAAAIAIFSFAGLVLMILALLMLPKRAVARWPAWSNVQRCRSTAQAYGLSCGSPCAP